jgi:hypothetical protein
VKKFLYFADFVFYPLASAALVALALLLKEPLRWDEAAIGFAFTGSHCMVRPILPPCTTCTIPIRARWSAHRSG